MDSEGHIKLTDFCLSKILDDSDDKTFTLCYPAIFSSRSFKKYRIR